MKFTKLAAAITLALAVSAAQADATNTFNVTLTVTGTCDAGTFSTPTPAVADVAFGSHVADNGSPALTATNNATGKLQVACSKDLVVTVGLTPSNAVQTGAGVMVGATPADQINYQLRQPIVLAGVYTPGYTVNWGNDLATNRVSVTGTGLTSPISIPVQATVAAGALDVAAGAYTDLVTATLYY